MSDRITLKSDRDESGVRMRYDCAGSWWRFAGAEVNFRDLMGTGDGATRGAQGLADCFTCVCDRCG